MQKWKRTAVRMRQQIRIGRLKEDRVRREYQEAIREKFKDARIKGYMSGNDAAKAWSELKEGLVGASSSVWGVVKRRHSGEKRSRWWNEEVKLAVRRKKLLYKRFLDTGTDEAKRQYNEAKTEAKRVVRKLRLIVPVHDHSLVLLMRANTLVRSHHFEPGRFLNRHHNRDI